MQRPRLLSHKTNSSESPSSSFFVTSQALTGLFRPRLITYSKVFQVVSSIWSIIQHYFQHPLFVPSFSHVISNFIVSPQFPSTGFYFQLFQNFLFNFVVVKCVPRYSEKNIIQINVNRFLSFFFDRPKFLFHIGKWEIPVHYIRLFLKISRPYFV